MPDSHAHPENTTAPVGSHYTGYDQLKLSPTALSLRYKCNWAANRLSLCSTCLQQLQSQSSSGWRRAQSPSHWPNDIPPRPPAARRAETPRYASNSTHSARLVQPSHAHIQTHLALQYPPPELLESLRPVHAACVQRTGVSEATIVEYSDARHPDDAAHAATDIEQLKCYMACVFEQTQVVDRNGDVHLETLYNRLPDSMKDVALKMGLRCLKVSGSGPCERAFWLHSCWKRSDPMHYFII